MGLFYSNESKSELNGYTDAEYLSDPHKAQSQIGYLFTCGDTTISWRSMKRTLVATSSNHAEIIVIHEASRECVWLRSMTHFLVRFLTRQRSKHIMRYVYSFSFTRLFSTGFFLVRF